MMVIRTHLSCLASIVVGLGGCFSPNQAVTGDGSAGEESTSATQGTGDSTTPGSATTVTTGPTNTTDETQGDATLGTDPTPGTDASETADTSAGSGSTDDGGPLCGNGMMDGAEACDDGDEVNGNGCNNDCVESGSVLWEVNVSDGYDVLQSTAAPFAESIAAAPSGGAAVTIPIEIQNGGVLTRWIDEDGAIVWGEAWSAFDSEIVATDVAIGNNGEVIVVGGQDTGSLFFSPFPVIQAYDENGIESWSDAPDDGNPEVDPFFGTVVVDSRGQIIAQAGSPNGGPLYNLLYVYDADGDVIQTENLLDEGAETVILESAIGGDDSIYSVHTAFEDDSVITRQTNAAVDVWSVNLAGVVAYGLAFGGGRIAAAGSAEPSGSWVGAFDLDGADVWSETFEGVAGATFNAVAVDGEGSVIAAGRRSDVGDPHAWVRKFSSEGAVLWDREFDGDAGVGDADAAEDVSVDAAGNIYIVTRREAGDADATWVVKLTP